MEDDILAENINLDRVMEAIEHGEGLAIRAMAKFEVFQHIQSQIDAVDDEAIDAITIESYRPLEDPSAQDDESEAIQIKNSLKLPIVLWASDDALVWQFQDILQRWSFPPKKRKRFREIGEALNERNRTLGYLRPDYLESGMMAKPAPIRTSPESSILFRAAADGKNPARWTDDAQRGESSYLGDANDHHMVVLSFKQRLSTASSGGAEIDYLRQIREGVDMDGCLAITRVIEALIPEGAVPADHLFVKRIELDDVIKAIGWAPETTEQRMKMRRTIFGYLEFFARAEVRGQRRGPAIPDSDGSLLDTYVQDAIVLLSGKEYTDLFNETPYAVDVALPRRWQHLMTHAKLAQWIPGADMLCDLSPNQATGAWARAMGWTLANFWRRNPSDAILGSLFLSRREILFRHAPKETPTAPSPESVIAGKNPLRLTYYYWGALQELERIGFICKDGDSALPRNLMQDTGLRQGWVEKWLDRRATLFPGPVLEPVLREIAQNRPIAYRSTARKVKGR